MTKMHTSSCRPKHLQKLNSSRRCPAGIPHYQRPCLVVHCACVWTLVRVSTTQRTLRCRHDYPRAVQELSALVRQGYPSRATKAAQEQLFDLSLLAVQLCEG